MEAGELSHPYVERALADVRSQRFVKVSPDPFEVGDFGAGDGLYSVLAQEIGDIHAQGSEADALDFNEGVKIRDVAVSVANNEVCVLGRERYFVVAHGRRLACWAVQEGFDVSCGFQTAIQACLPAVQEAHVLEPVLPLGMDRVTLFENHEGLCGELLPHVWESCFYISDAVVGLAGTPVVG
ncbi:hypothetical protein AB0G15_05530 [Streptosporangium sp. NPDC023825]|uniref:hypothetical protein n=1 Tax=Streptosporangium sp. NPDC023825 TaxID=3154909 RepID=UPI0034372982